MTVAELIEKLKEMPQEATVLIPDGAIHDQGLATIEDVEDDQMGVYLSPA